MTTQNQLAVVTGASSGIGRATARELAGRGYHVLAGVRSEADADELSSSGVEGVILDITDPAQIAAVARRVADDPAGRSLGVLVNNAGVALNAPIEMLPIEAWRTHFEVNFFGHVALTQALLPALLDGGGRIVNLSSIGGRVAFPTYGAYAAAKFALEGMSDALRREVGRHGVKVIVIEPGTIATPIWGKGLETMAQATARASGAQRARYADLLAVMSERAGANAREGKGVTPADAARRIADLIAKRRPPARHLLGRDAKVLGRLARLLPDRALDRMIARTLRLGEPGEAPVARDATLPPRQAPSAA